MECTDQNGKFTSEAHMHIQDVIIAWCKLLVALEMRMRWAAKKQTRRSKSKNDERYRDGFY